MKTENTRKFMIASIILILLAIAFGIWLAISGKPYGTMLFTVHKLAGFAALVCLGIFTVHLIKSKQVKKNLTALVVTAAVSLIALLVTGVVLSLANSPLLLINLIHIICTAAALISAIALMNKFNKRNST